MIKKRFVLLGVGYVAPRHVQAIKAVGGELMAMLDPHDSVGWIDKYFPDAKYFREFERFDRFCHKCHLEAKPIHYAVICTPNYLHEPQSRWAMRNGMDVICEKPLALNERNVDSLSAVERETRGPRLFAVLQSRLHPAAIAAKEKFSSGTDHLVQVEYQTPRGAWYSATWKGDESKSGGILTNIGIHLFDLCLWLFGDQIPKTVFAEINSTSANGKFHLERATVFFDLSIKQGEPKRIFKIDGEQFDLTSGFDELHTETYRKILAGEGFTIKDALPAIRLVEAIKKNSHKEGS